LQITRDRFCNTRSGIHSLTLVAYTVLILLRLLFRALREARRVAAAFGLGVKRLASCSYSATGIASFSIAHS
jgi:hypothetical protein